MKTREISLGPILVCVFSAALLWFFAFRIPWGNFWIKISFSATILAVASLWITGGFRVIVRFDFSAFILGLLSAALLYAFFWIGQVVSETIFTFAHRQIGSIYTMGGGMPHWTVALLLFFITGPAEEIFWRGFLQNRLSSYFGGWQGWLMCSALYAGVHVVTWNFMLVGAAAVAGLYWGLLFWRLGNLATVIISHAVWSVVIFTIFPTM